MKDLKGTKITDMVFARIGSNEKLLLQCRNRTIQIYDVSTGIGLQERVLDAVEPIQSMSVSPGPHPVVAVSCKGLIKYWALDTGVFLLEKRADSMFIMFTENGAETIEGGSYNGLKRWKVDPGFSTLR